MLCGLFCSLADFLVGSGASRPRQTGGFVSSEKSANHPHPKINVLGSLYEQQERKQTSLYERGPVRLQSNLLVFSLLKNTSLLFLGVCIKLNLRVCNKMC